MTQQEVERHLRDIGQVAGEIKNAAENGDRMCGTFDYWASTLIFAVRALRALTAAPPTEGAIPREADEAMLLAMHDGPLGGGDEIMGDEQREWLREMWRAGYDAAPKATEGAAMEALRELVALNDSPLPAACDLDRHMRAWAAARALLASPIAPPTDRT